MSARITIRPAAERDLLQIGIESERRWGTARTRAYLQAIADAFDNIAEMPGIGTDQTDVVPGVRKLRSGVHNIYYRVGGETVLIVRVLHQRMDIDAHLTDD